MKTFRIGSRESKLAVIQSEMLIDYINKNIPGTDAQLITMKTTGDVILDRALENVGGKGLFVKELDKALMEGRTDVSVHSLKDLPMEVSEELPIVGFSKREDPRDAFVLPMGCTEWDKTKPIGVAGKRRIVQLKKLFPDVKTQLIRGNVITRLRKLDEGQYGAIILAAAGLKRLGLESRITKYFELDEMMPAAGQAILAVQGRAGVDYSELNGFFDEEATCCALAERAFVRALNGGCSSPIAAYATLENERITLRGLYCEEDSFDFVKGQIEGPAEQAEELGRALAQELLGGKNDR